MYMGLGFDGFAALQEPLERDKWELVYVCACARFSDVTLYNFRLISPILRQPERERERTRGRDGEQKVKTTHRVNDMVQLY